MIDWFRVISDLERSGLTLRSQADAVRVSAATVHYWKSGGEPRYSHGQIMVSLYIARTNQPLPLQSTLSST